MSTVVPVRVPALSMGQQAWTVSVGPVVAAGGWAGAEPQVARLRVILYRTKIASTVTRSSEMSSRDPIGFSNAKPSHQRSLTW